MEWSAKFVCGPCSHWHPTMMINILVSVRTLKTPWSQKHHTSESVKCFVFFWNNFFKQFTTRIKTCASRLVPMRRQQYMHTTTLGMRWHCWLSWSIRRVSGESVRSVEKCMRVFNFQLIAKPDFSGFGKMRLLVQLAVVGGHAWQNTSHRIARISTCLFTVWPVHLAYHHRRWIHD